jgi:hypothetical protein
MTQDLTDLEAPCPPGTKIESITNDEQLQRWVDGESVHSSLTGECCPDFSCCRPELLSTPEFRIAFQEAHQREDEAAVMSMLGSCLGAAFATMGKADEVYVAGLPKAGEA